MANRLVRQLVEGFEELTFKLRLGLPIKGTRVQRCECRGKGCKACRGTGAVRRRVRLK